MTATSRLVAVSKSKEARATSHRPSCPPAGANSCSQAQSCGAVPATPGNVGGTAASAGARLHTAGAGASACGLRGRARLKNDQLRSRHWTLLLNKAGLDCKNDDGDDSQQFADLTVKTFIDLDQGSVQ